MDEHEHIEVLKDYAKLDSSRAPAFDAITRLTSSLLEMPIAVISIVDTNRVSFKSAVGLNIDELPIEESFCSVSDQTGSFYEIEDTFLNDETREHPMTVGDMGIRYYSSVPLREADGTNHGCLFIMDRQPRKLTQEQQKTFKELADVIVAQLESQFRLNQALKNELSVSYTLKAILDNSAESIILFDKSFKVLSVNEVAQTNLLALRGKKVSIGDDYRENLTPSSSKTFFELFNKAIAGDITEVEDYTISKLGQGWYRYKTAPVYDNAGLLMGVLYTATSINKRKKAELALQESEEKFRKIVESAANPIFILDKEMKVVLVNHEVEAIFGFAKEELINESIETIVSIKFLKSHQKYHPKYASLKRANRMVRQSHAPAITKNGEEILVEANINTFELNGESFLLVILQDVTLRIHSEEKIKNQVKRLKAISWHQSHEVRQPLVNILGLADLIKKEKDQGYNELYIDYLAQAAKDLDRVIHQIVRYTIDSE